MAKRITIMIDDDLDKKIRLTQSKMILSENKSVSFSSVINSLLEKQLAKKK
ncbi:MAG: hypothetical protein ACO2Y5_01450 [Nitrosopumilaceae archaeon]|uniref:Uncharacterized protein n=1 Tax=Candidatus Nitrosomaritimum aestuariumsis TaxID=3342354 RepID=A0AC60W2X4_9ARCH|nr:hypothetical protein [Nitrosopumilaceae archaeon]